MTRFLKIFAVLLVTAMGASAQYTNVLDNATTQEVDSVWNAGPVYVGDSTSNNVLRIVNGGQVTASGAVLGTTQEAFGNELLIVGTNASWSSAGEILVGQSGSKNYLEVSGGTDVSAGALYAGREEVSSNNVAVISGAGTTLSVGADILSGARGRNNLLVMESGARVESLWGGVGYDATATNNFLIVTGKGTSWNITNDLWVGNQGDGNQFQVLDGATVTNSNGYVGFYADGPSADSNAVVVSGTDARWVNLNTLQLGAENVTSNTGNSIAVAEGGTIAAGNLVIEGQSNNFYLADGGTLELESSLDVSQEGFNWNDGGHLSLAGELTGMEVTNGASVLDGGRDLTLRGANGAWNVGADLAVGMHSGDSHLIISNGASVVNQNGFIGSGTNSQNNSVLVTGSGSFWRNDGTELTIGLDETSSGNSLAVTNEAWVYVGDAATNDVAATAAGGMIVAKTNGTATLTADHESNVDISGTLYVGGTNASALGQVWVGNDSEIKTDELVVNNPGSEVTIANGGTLFVDGAYNADTLTQVDHQSGGELKVGGVLTKSDALSGEGKTLTLAEDASWTTAVPTVVEGSNNTVNVTGGSELVSTNGTVIGNGNTVNVSGSGAVWNNTGDLNLSGTNNSVNIAGGGRVSTAGIDIEDGNHINLNSGGTLSLSNFNWMASSNLNWESGGHVAVSGTLEGMESVELVSGTDTNQYTYLDGGKGLALDGSEWIAGSDTNLIVGYNSSGTSLYITNAADVANKDGFIGWGSGSGNNKVVVSDAGSTWTNSGGHLYVGVYLNGTNLVQKGSGNSLTVKNGAQVFVGDEVSTNSGMLVASSEGAELVIGGGTVTVEDTLYLGTTNGASGSATIRSGGTLSVDELVIDDGFIDLLGGGTFRYGGAQFDVSDWSTNGFNWGTNGTLSIGGVLTGMINHLDLGRNLTLNGSNAVWNVGSDLYVGSSSNFNSAVTIYNGASLTNQNVFIGAHTNDTGSKVDLGSGSRWQVNGDVYVGYLSSGNDLIVGDDSTNYITGSVFIGNGTTDNEVLLIGTNNLWSVDGAVQVGDASGGSNNTLKVSEASHAVVSSDLSVYGGNAVLMDSEALIEVGGDMTVYSNAVVDGAGIIQFTDADTALKLMNGTIGISSDILFAGINNTVDVSGGTFEIIGTNTNRFTGFKTLVMNDAVLSGFGQHDSFDETYMTNSSISPFTVNSDGSVSGLGTLDITGAFSASNVTYHAQVFATDHDQLNFTGGDMVDLSGLLAHVGVAQVPTNENQTVTILTSTGGLTNGFDAVTVTDSLLLFDARVTNMNDRVDVVVYENGDEFSSSLALAATESVRAGFDGMKNSVMTRTKQLRRNVVATAHNVKAAPIPEEDVDAPVGAYGPGDENTIFDMHVWAQYFNGQGVYDEHGASYGFNLNHNGTTIGFDRLVGEDLTVGFNYTYSRTRAQTTNTDTLDSETYWLGLYGEWVSTEGLYVDTMAAYGRSSYDSVRIEQVNNTDYRGTASYRGNALGAYMDVGQYYYYRNWALSPYVGLHALFANTAEHAEDNGQGDTLYVDSVNRTWIESALGLKARYRFDTGIGRFQATGFAEWTHDFIGDDVRNVMSADSIDHSVGMAAIKPDDDMITTGLGLGWICTDYLEIGVGYNGRFSEHYEEHTGTLMFDVMF